MAFDPEAGVLATLQFHRGALIWSWRDGRAIGRFDNPFANDVRYSADGRFLAICGTDYEAPDSGTAWQARTPGSRFLVSYHQGADRPLGVEGSSVLVMAGTPLRSDNRTEEVRHAAT